MTAKTSQNHLTPMLRTKIGQGVVAFLVGAATFYAIGLTLSGFSGLGTFLFNNLLYVPSTTPWTSAGIFWSNAPYLLNGLMMMAVITAVTTAVLILVFRLIELKPKWPVLRKVFIWTIAANALVLLLSYLEPYLVNDSASIWTQTGVGYLQLVSLGLPYTFAWLWGTRKVKR